MLMSLTLFPLSSIMLIIFGFMLRSLIHLNLIFVQEDKEGSFLILLNTDQQVVQHHLWRCCLYYSCVFGLWEFYWFFCIEFINKTSVKFSLFLGYLCALGIRIIVASENKLVYSLFLFRGIVLVVLVLGLLWRCYKF